MKRKSFSEAAWCIVAAFGLSVVVGGMAQAQTGVPGAPQPPPQTSDQKDRLKERDRLAEQIRTLKAQRKLADAIAAAEKKLAIEREAFGNANEKVEASLEQLGDMYSEREDYPRAHAAWEELIALRIQLYGKDHYSVTDARRGLADVDRTARFTPDEKRKLLMANLFGIPAAQHFKQGKFHDALPLLQQLLPIQQQLWGDHFTTAMTLLAIAHALDQQEKPQEAKGYYDQGLPMARKVLGEKHPLTAGLLNAVGQFLNRRGEFVEARKCFEQVLDICRALRGRSPEETRKIHAYEARALAELGRVSFAQRDYAQALSLFQRALTIYKELYGEDSPGVASVLANMGVLLDEQGKYEESRRYHERALALHTKIFGESHPDTVLCLSNLGIVLMNLGRLDAAKQCLEKVLAYRRQRFGTNHIDTAIALCNLATLQIRRGAFEASQLNVKEGYRVFNNLLGADHPKTIRALANRGWQHFVQGQVAAARPWFEQVFSLRLAGAHNMLPALSEAEALAYVDDLRSWRDPLICAWQHSGGVPPEKVYDLVWQTRGLATRVMVARRNLAGNRPEGRALWERLHGIRSQLAALTRAAVSADKAQARHEALIKLNEEKEACERALATVSGPFERDQEISRVAAADLAACLPRHTAVVDLVLTNSYEPSVNQLSLKLGIIHYDAFVLRRTDDQRGYRIDWVPLGEAKLIDHAVRSFREAIMTGANPAAPDSPEQILRRLVWEPIERHLQRCSTVIMIADGSLTQLPWAALPGKRPGSYLLEDYTIGTATYGQQLHAFLTQSASPNSRLLLVGGVAYDHSWTPNPNELVASVHRSPPLEGNRRPHWDPLPASLREARTSAALWNQPDRTTFLHDAEASRAALRQHLPAARYIHLATHGFFADPKFRSAFQHDVASERLTLSDIGLVGGRGTVTGRNPLILSGVVLAGANEPPATNEWGAPVGDDGILTGEEVAEMDLGGTDLVVLSACETGVGEVAGGEGVFSLQRAFHLAGARTVIASLWKVDDEVTQQLMTHFYANLWQKQMKPLEALRQAQLSILNGSLLTKQTRGLGAIEAAPMTTRRERAHPRFWAAWVLSGDPGNLVPAEQANQAPVSAGLGDLSGMLGGLMLVLVGLSAWQLHRGRERGRGVGYPHPVPGP